MSSKRRATSSSRRVAEEMKDAPASVPSAPVSSAASSSSSFVPVASSSSKRKTAEPVAMDAADDDVEVVSAEVVDAAASKAPAATGERFGSKALFSALTAEEASEGKSVFRSVLVPPHRYGPLKASWLQIYTPLVEQMKLQVRMNVRTRSVEMRTSKDTVEPQSIQKAEDFVKAFVLGFEASDALALLRLDDLYVESFDVTDVRQVLSGDNLSRAVGRIAGKAGQVKYAIENATRTRIVLAETRVHILGSFQNIKLARDAVCDLVIGSPPGKVYGKLRSVASRLAERF